MKKSDIAMIILIASVSVLVAFFVANSLPFLKLDPAGVKYKTIDKIEGSVTPPDETVFNKDAINPTVKTVIGGSGE